MKQSWNFDVREVAVFQKNEITEHYIYKNLSGRVTGIRERRILSQIADDEMRHYNVWKTYTHHDVAPNRLKLWFYTVVGMLFGFTFVVRLMGKAEQKTHDRYSRLPESFKEVNGIVRDEEEHEQALITLFDEESLLHTGSMVLGLNSVTVQLIGVLATLTFAFENSSFVVLLTVSVTGFAAALSLAVSAYLSLGFETGGTNRFMTALFIGFAAFLIALALVAPYLLVADRYVCLIVSFAISVSISSFFSFYLAVVRGESFSNRFLSMVALSLLVVLLCAAVGYCIGLVAALTS